MEQVLGFLLSNHALAMVLPGVIFLFTVFLVARRLIGFFITLLFFLFALGAGLAIANYEVVTKYVQENRMQISQVEGQMGDFKKEMARAFRDLEADLREQRQAMRQVVQAARDVADDTREQSASLRHFVEETLEPALKKITKRVEEQGVSSLEVSVEEALPRPLEDKDGE